MHENLWGIVKCRATMLRSTFTVSGPKCDR
jgi:hypothetical protein